MQSLATTTMNCRPKNLKESLMPLMTLQAVIGHGVFYCPLGKSTLRISIVYSVTIVTVYLASLYYAANIALKSDWLLVEESSILFITFVNTAIWAFAGVLSWYYRKSIIEIVQKISIIDESLIELGGPCDYDRLFRFGIKAIVLCFLGLIVTVIIDITWIYGKMPLMKTIFICAIYHYPVHVNTIFCFNFAAMMGLITTRFKNMNDILEKISSKSSKSHPENRYHFWRKNKETSGSLKRISVGSTRNTSEMDERLVQIIKHMHLELCEVPKEIERAYGVQIVLEMAANFVTLTAILYNVYWLLTHRSQLQFAEHMATMIFWFAVYFMKLLFLNCSCVKMVAEVERTGQIIHQLKAPNSEVSFKDEIKQFGLQMTIYPVSMIPAGMFTLDHRLITTFLGTMITYLVIVIEMDIASLGRGKNKIS